jgi:hypothetical protein
MQARELAIDRMKGGHVRSSSASLNLSIQFEELNQLVTLGCGKILIYS